MTIGKNAQADQDSKNAIAIGTGAKTQAEDAIAIGTGATATGKGSTAIGQYGRAIGIGSTAFGGLQTTDRKGYPVTYKNTANGAASVAFGEGTTANGTASLAFGMNTVAGSSDGSGQQSVAFGEDTQALGGRSLAFGEKTIAKYNDSVAFGNDTRASSTGATAFGNRTRALSSYSTAWGNATVAADEESTAWGTDTIAGAKLDANGALTNNYTENGTQKSEKMDAHGNLAYVSNGTTYGIKQMAIDTGSEKHDYVVLSGQDGNKYVRDYQGSLWKVNVDEASGTVTVDTTVGTKGKVYNNGRNQTSLANTTINGSSVAITPDSVLNKAHEGTNGYDIEGYANATAFGYSTEASGDNATAWGNDTTAAAAGATAFGNGTTASGVNATAWGESSTASGEAATAFGISSTASGKNSLAGLGGTAANENSIALGKDTKANNTTENAVSVAIGQNAEASGAQSLAIGFGNITEQKADSTTTTGDKNYPVNNTVATAKGAIAIGVNTASKGEHSVAMGSYTDAAKDSSVAIGFDTHTLSDSTVAIGSGTQARGRYSVAMGLSSVAGTETNDDKNPLDGGGSVAIGYAASAEASRSIAIGTGANAYENEFTTAIGDSATASQKGSVAVGAGSNATRAAGNREANTTYLAAYRSPANVTSETDTTKKATWVATEGAVSVGGNTKYWDYDDNGNRVKKTAYLTRQITNVAAGSADTDAVNVAQLKAAGVTVTSKDNSVGITTTTDPTDYHTNYDLKVATATLTTSNGTVTNTNPKTADGKTDITNAYATGDSVANAINNSGFNLTTSASNGTVSGTSTELINPGETVTLDAGKNIAITQAQNKITVALADDVNAQTVTVTGKDGKDGQIGLTGKDGKEGKVTTIIRTIGKNGTDGTDGKPGVDGTNITRVVYQDGQDGEAGTTTHTVATLDDGLKFIGDDNAATPVAKKLNETLQIRGDGTYDATTKKVADDGNIKTSVANGAVKVSLSDKINLHQNGSLTLGGDTNGTEKDGTDPITIRHFDDKTLDVITGVDKEGKFITSKEGKAGDYITGLDNKNWSVENPTYVSGRAATEDQLKVVSDAAKNATTAAGKHTLLTVNDKDTDETKATAGTKAYGNYAGADKNENLLIAAKEDDGQLTYNIKLNDQLNIGKKGADGTDGKVTVDTKGGTTVIIGHDGENGKDGKDGLFVRGNDGKDGKSGVSIIGPNGQTGDAGIDGKVGIAGKDGKDAVSIAGKGGVGHIGLTGEAGKDGKNASADVKVINGPVGVDGTDGNKGTAGMDRMSYEDHNGKNHTVATMEDGLKFIGDDNTATPIAKKLNETLQIRGDGTYDATTKKVADDGNIKTSVADGAVKVSLSDKINLHQNGSLTLGGDANGTEKDGTDPIMIRHFDDKTLDVITGVDKEGKPITSKEGKAGDYITGLDNKTWNNESYVSGRAATEDQLHQVVNNLIGPNASGGFGLSANGSEVKQALGKTIAINGDGTYGTDGKETKAGNISTSVEKGAVKVSLNTDLNIDSTTMEKKDADGNTITNKTTAEGSTVEKKDASGKTTASTSTNAGALTIKNGDVTTTINENGVSTNKVTVGDKTTIDNGSATIGGVTINGNGEKDGTDQHASTITGLSNKTFDTAHTEQYKDSGRAATEAQLKEVYDKAAAHSTVTVNGKPSADGNLKLDTTTNQDGSTNYALSLNNDITLGDKEKSGKLTVKSQDGTKSITTNGEDGTLTFKDGSNETAIKAADAVKGVDGTTDIKRVAVDNHTVATLDDGMKFAGDSGEALKQKLNSTTNIKGGASGELSDGNIGVVSDGKDTLTVKLARDIKGLDSVETKTVNAETVNTHTVNIAGDSSHSAITIKQGDVNMGGNTISGVAPGKVSPDSTEAVNGSQLYARDQAIGKLGNTVNHLDDKINRAGAGAAALAALHPQDFDPDDKWDFAAGYGNYHGASAAAIGAFYRPTEDVMVSVGGSMGGGENMVNAGVTFKLGQHNHVSNSRVAMAKEIRDLKATVGQLTQMVNQLTGNGGGRTLPLRKGDTLFPDVPKNHWAYDYVTKLAQAGLLEGYPDGEFKGNRMMTRYEFATLVYRAIMGGAAANPKLNQGGTLDRLVDEFGDELQYIRIVVIDRDKDGKPTIERVRTVEDDRKHHHGKEREQQPLEQGL
ncbi:S-layer homology domain-containing protein [Acidaminococcus timonensis]|uniref:S-layer homology domain-containing protein n=1 Tax=Acidaminococcus timonensis TaxID=1871002 RepID=UPI0026ED56A0|nr:S-layer homology domain-containing protein [Acidaminococcus timonensis]